MPKHISFERSYFVALWLQTLIYGFYVVLFFGCMYILLFRRTVACSRIIPTLVVLLFVLSTAHVIVNFVKCLRAWTVVDDPNVIFADFASKIDLAKESVYVITAAFADTLLIYRCFMVWGHDWRIVVLPLMLLMLGTAAGFVSIYEYSLLDAKDGAQYADNLMKWLQVFYAAMVANNTLTTILIATRIWWSSRRSGLVLGARHQAKYNFVIAVVIESGAIYAISLLIYLVLYSIESQAQKLILDSLCQIAAIMPTLIVVRIGLGMNPYERSTTFQTTADSIQFRNRFGKPVGTESDANQTLTASERTDRLWPRGRAVVNIDMSTLSVPEAHHRDDVSKQSFVLHPEIVDEGSAPNKV